MSDFKRGILCVSAGVILNLFLGCFYLWGNISVYVTSYFYMHDREITLDDTSLIFPIQMVGMILFVPVAPFALKVLPPWLCCLIGSCIAIGAAIIASFTTNFIIFMVLYGFFFGLGCGIAYLAPIITSWDYFPERKGLVSGIILAGYGLGPFIFGYISSAIANPENESPTHAVEGGVIFSPDHQISTRAPQMIRVNALAWLGLIIISSPFIRKRKAQNKEEQIIAEDRQELVSSAYETNREGNEDNFTSPVAADMQPEVIENKKFKAAMFSLTSLQIFIMMALTGFYPNFLAINFKSYGQVKISSDIFMTTVGAVASVTNGFTRIGWATLFDKFGFKYVYIGLLLVQSANAFTIQLIRGVPILYLIWVSTGFLCLAGLVTLFPPLLAKVFGPKTGSRVYSFLFSSLAVAAIGCFFLNMLSSKGKISQEVLFYIFGGLTVVALVIAIFFKEVRVRLKEDPNKLEEETRRFSVFDYTQTF
ncbi:unnamed protein product [Moneuplotes crassus]|uniref:Major facilitator superfamily (MFS) profile domain-containing protein n=1 Tax=Euplotes crassus TaxID=5936 RepID=A0AAD1X5I4_EUPCR|nr:unnamed protein product [Moneuplotes crassus]